MSDLPTEHPTGYADWLTRHSDADLVDLLWRLRSFHPGAVPGTGRPAVVTGASGDAAALRELTAAQLAVLHGLVAAGAVTAPVVAADLDTALTGLFTAAGTRDDHRTGPAQQEAAVGDLAHWGLVFGPDLTLHGWADPAADHAAAPLRVPAHLGGLFTATTDLPWLLVDGYRCPVPTADLPGVLAALPDRQRRLLDTLATAGGIGHSNTLDDPERPLSRMIGAGLLDRVDEHTARLSPRVGAAVEDRLVPPPGGDFTVPAPVEPTAHADGSAVARVVETVRLVAELLTAAGTAPLHPLTAGGVGIREISRIAKQSGLTTEETTEALLLARHADLVASGLPLPSPANDTGGDLWSVTERGARFLTAPLERRWAMLLLGWVLSPHTPWEAAGTDAHLLEQSLDHPRTADLRSVVPALLSVRDTPDAATTAGLLWRLRPAVAASTGTADLAGVLSEATALGLTAEGLPSHAAPALAQLLHDADGTNGTDGTDFTGAEDALTDVLNGILPPPTHQLIVQADMTVLAPGRLTPDDEAELRAFADLESTGMASVWRVSAASLRRAAEAGESAAGVLAFLRSMAPDLPQSLEYLVTDSLRDVRRPTAGTADSWLTTPDEATMTALLTTPAAVAAGLRRIAPTVAVSNRQLSRVIDLLDDGGITVGIDGDNPGASRGPQLSTVPDPAHPRPVRADVEEQLAGSVEAFRRSREAASATDADPDGTGETDTDIVRDPHAIMAALRDAYDHGTRVEISYVNADGGAVQEWISVVTMSPVSIVGVSERDGTSLQIRPHRVAWVGVPATA
jgi:hypothetical protein